LDVRPRPHERLSQLRDGLGEVGVPPAPIVDDLRPFDADAFGDLSRAYKLVHVDPPTHAGTLRTPGILRADRLRMAIRKRYPTCPVQARTHPGGSDAAVITHWT